MTNRNKRNATHKAPLSPRARYETSPEKVARVAETAAASLSRGVRVISATEAARTFSDLINRVSYKGETYVVERGGRPVCQVSPPPSRPCSGADLLRALSALPRPSEEFLAAVEKLARTQAPVEPSAWEK